MYRKLVIIGVLALLVVGCGNNYEFDGLYSDGNYLSSEQDVKFCTVVKGNMGISALMRQARSNPAILTNLDEIKTIARADLEKLELKYQLKGQLKLTIGTDIGSWKKLDYAPFERPCVNDDKVISFIHHIKAPFSQKTKDGISFLNINGNGLEMINKAMKTYKGVPVYGLVWEAVSGRKVDKGWVFKLSSE